MVYGRMQICAPRDARPSVSLFYSSRTPIKRSYSAHHHTAFEIGLYKAGRGTYLVGDRKYAISPGDVFVFAPDQVHFITSIDEDMCIMNLQVEPSFIWSPGGDLFDASYLSLFSSDENRPTQLRAGTPLCDRVTELLTQIEAEFTGRKSGWEWMVKAHILTLLVLLSRDFSPLSEPEHFSGQTVAAVSAALDYINRNLTQPITLQALSEVSGVSRNYLCAAFRKLNGATLWSYILIKRIDLAREYLRKSDRTVLDIAICCGFNSTANFNKAFRKYTGCTPSQYRNAKSAPAEGEQPIKEQTNETRSMY